MLIMTLDIVWRVSHELHARIPGLLDRLGDGHGRRVLLLASGVEEVDVMTASLLARRAWAVRVRTLGVDAAESGRAHTEAAGVVVDWRAARRPGDPTESGRFAVVLGAEDPGLADEATCAELSRVLQVGGALLMALPRGGEPQRLTGFDAVSIAESDGLRMLSARRR